MNKEKIAKMDNDGLIYTTINQQEAGIYFNGVKIANAKDWNEVVENYNRVQQENKQLKELLDKYNNQDKDLIDENEAISRIEFEIESALKNKNTTIAGRMDIERIKQMQLEKGIFKNAWQELKDRTKEFSYVDDEIWHDIINELEQKYNLGGVE